MNKLNFILTNFSYITKKLFPEMFLFKPKKLVGICGNMFYESSEQNQRILVLMFCIEMTK